MLCLALIAQLAPPSLYEASNDPAVWLALDRAHRDDQQAPGRLDLHRLHELLLEAAPRSPPGVASLVVRFTSRWLSPHRRAVQLWFGLSLGLERLLLPQPANLTPLEELDRRAACGRLRAGADPLAQRAQLERAKALGCGRAP